LSVEKTLARFRTEEARKTKAGRLLSDYFTQRIADVPFETAASIAAHLDISPMTVTRYLRDRGYGSLDALKSELRMGPINSAWDISENFESLNRDLRDGRLLSDLVAKQIEVLHSLNGLTHEPRWQQAVAQITGSASIYIASFQNIGGISRYFAEQLAYVRSGVRYMDGLNGTYLELFEGDPAGRLLIIIDCRRFATKSRLLAEAASEAKLPIVVVTDAHCDWADRIEATILKIPAMRWRTWDSFMPLAALLDLIVTNAIIVEGDKVLERGQVIRRLQSHFGDFE
jgi:DNA-binding MurR/RpiR family transcriptional regulator